MYIHTTQHYKIKSTSHAASACTAPEPTALQQQAVSMQQTQEIPLNFALPRLYKIKKVVTLYTFLTLFLA